MVKSLSKFPVHIRSFRKQRKKKKLNEKGMGRESKEGGKGRTQKERKGGRERVRKEDRQGFDGR